MHTLLRILYGAESISGKHPHPPNNLPSLLFGTMYVYIIGYYAAHSYCDIHGLTWILFLQSKTLDDFLSVLGI